MFEELGISLETVLSRREFLRKSAGVGLGALGLSGSSGERGVRGDNDMGGFLSIRQLRALGRWLGRMEEPATVERQKEVNPEVVEPRERAIFTPQSENQNGLRQPDVSQIPLPEIISRIPPFPSDVSIHTPGYWPDIPWGEQIKDEPGKRYHAWGGTFEGVLGTDDQRVYVNIDLDIGEGVNMQTVAIPVAERPANFSIITINGESPIYSTGNVEEAYAVLSRDNWWQAGREEPIIIAIRDEFRGMPPHIKIIAFRTRFQSW